MKLYKQSDKRWKDLKIGKTPLTIGKYGCLITSLAMMDGRTPEDINILFTNNNGYVDADGVKDIDLSDDFLVDHKKAAKILGMKFNGITKYPIGICIACTNHFKKSGFPQHFFVWLGDGKILDPIDGRLKENQYPIVSYRLYYKEGLS